MCVGGGGRLLGRKELIALLVFGLCLCTVCLGLFALPFGVVGRLGYILWLRLFLEIFSTFVTWIILWRAKLNIFVAKHVENDTDFCSMHFFCSHFGLTTLCIHKRLGVRERYIYRTKKKKHACLTVINHLLAAFIIQVVFLIMVSDIDNSKTKITIIQPQRHKTNLWSCVPSESSYILIRIFTGAFRIAKDACFFMWIMTRGRAGLFES